MDSERRFRHPRCRVLALLLGDCTGIGPELCARVLADKRLADAARIVVVGDARVLEMGMRDAGVELSIATVSASRTIDWDGAATPLIDLGNIDPAAMPPARCRRNWAGSPAKRCAEAIRLAKAGEVDGITFAPLNKAALHAGGWKFPDEHKMFAHLLGHNDYFSEMNVLDGQWMSRVTSHVSLREALDQINPETHHEAIELADRTMRRAGIDKPRIAVAALNPHAGENGLFGREEIELIRPTVEKAAATRHRLHGPVPVRHGLYLKAFAGEYRQRRRRCITTRARSRRSCAASTAASPSRPGSTPCSPRPRTAPPSTSSARASPRQARWKAPCGLRRNWPPRSRALPRRGRHVFHSTRVTRGALRTTYRIAVIPGDGIGKEVDAGGRARAGSGCRRSSASSCSSTGSISPPATTTRKHGRMMPEDWKEKIGAHDAIFFGAVGWPATVPDHVSLWGSLIQFRREFDQYVNLRPVRLMPGVPSPLAGRKPGDIDFLVVRENTEGEYSAIGGRMFPGTDREFVVQETVMTRIGVDRVLKFAFELAQKRRRSTSPRRPSRTASRSRCRTGTSASRRWRRAYPDVALGQVPHRHPDRAFRAATRTGSTSSSRRTCSATSSPTSARPAPARSASRRRATSTRSASSRRCSSRCTARRRTSPGKGIANPIGQIWSGAMMLEHLGEPEAAARDRRGDRETCSREPNAAHARSRRGRPTPRPAARRWRTRFKHGPPAIIVLASVAIYPMRVLDVRQSRSL